MWETLVDCFKQQLENNVMFNHYYKLCVLLTWSQWLQKYLSSVIFDNINIPNRENTYGIVHNYIELDLMDLNCCIIMASHLFLINYA